MKPPTTEPAMPSRIVTMAPPGSRPGMMAFAIIPAIKPKTIQPIIANIFFSSDSQVTACAPEALGPKPRVLFLSLFKRRPGRKASGAPRRGGPPEREELQSIGAGGAPGARRARRGNDTP